MTLPNSWVLCYVHEKDELYDQERLQQFFTRLSERNCSVSLASEIASLAIWRKYLVNAPTEENNTKRGPFAEVLRPHVSQGLRKQALGYVLERQEQLVIAVRSIHRSPLARGFELTITLAPTEGYILLSVDQERFFRPTLEGLAKYRYWIRIIEEVYDCWRPLYAYEFSHEGTPPVYLSWEDVRALRIPALFALNIYGPELLHQQGRQRILDTPAWLVRELPGPGCLLIPTDPHGFKPQPTYAYDDVARYLGFPMAHRLPDRSI